MDAYAIAVAEGGNAATMIAALEPEVPAEEDTGGDKQQDRGGERSDERGPTEGEGEEEGAGRGREETGHGSDGCTGDPETGQAEERERSQYHSNGIRDMEQV